ncbi:hypothetical protein CR513_05922, partial [Mucuna pruriens]
MEYQEKGSIGALIFLGCILGLLLWFWISWLVLECWERREIQNTQVGGMEVARIRVESEANGQDQVLSFVPKAYIARMAMRALPPVTCFRGYDETNEYQRDCPICMEEFINGELIQPFAASFILVYT